MLVVVFEIGSTLCAAAPSSRALIIGRAITGFGGAGSLAGAAIIMTDLVPLRKRPKYQGVAGAVFGIASIVGPPVGGVLTTKASWRWCFWLNLCVGVPALAGILFFLPASPPPEKRKGTFTEKLWKLDPVGNVLLAPGLVCVLLALQWGGTKYAWNDYVVLALLALGSALFIAFAATQCFQVNGMLPPRVLRQRSVAAGVFVSIGFGAALIIPTFYLPIWFQAIKGTTAVDAGVKLLPLFLSTCVFVIATGFGMAKTGYYTPWLIVGCAIRMVGAGLLATLRVDAGTTEWVGYQVSPSSLYAILLRILTLARIDHRGPGNRDDAFSSQSSRANSATEERHPDRPHGYDVHAISRRYDFCLHLSSCPSQHLEQRAPKEIAWI